METPNSTVITKKLNGNVSVVTEGDEFTLPVRSSLLKQGDNVLVRDASDKTIATFNFNTVEKVVDENISPSDTPINDVDTLYDELDANFFFELTGVPSGVSVPEEIIQTLNDGNNVIIHNLDKQVIGFVVLDGNDFVETTGSIIDSNNFNINLAGGGPIVDAKIILTYIN